MIFCQVPADGSCPAPKPHKAPRRVLHFSDGTLEEYSTDEEDGASSDALQTNDLPVVNIDPVSVHHFITNRTQNNCLNEEIKTKQNSIFFFYHFLNG